MLLLLASLNITLCKSSLHKDDDDDCYYYHYFYYYIFIILFSPKSDLSALKNKLFPLHPPPPSGLVSEHE